MSIRGVYFSYPTLGHLDDVLGGFEYEVTYQYQPDNRTIKLVLDINLDNAEFQKLLDEGRAAFGVEIECSASYFRVAEQTTRSHFEFEISEDKLRGKVVVSVFIAATEDLPYKLNSFHTDFDKVTFNVPSGSYIGWAGSRTFYADKTFDPMRAPAGSFIKVKKQTSETDLLEVEYDDDILIYLPKKSWQQYQAIKNYAVPVIWASLVLPVLVEAISGIQNNNELGANEKLEEILKSRDLLKTPPFLAAQQLLQSPVPKAIATIESILTMPGEEE